MIASFSFSFLYLCLFSAARVNCHRPCKHSNVRYGLVSSAPVSAVGLACSNARTSSYVRIVVLARSVYALLWSAAVEVHPLCVCVCVQQPPLSLGITGVLISFQS